MDSDRRDLLKDRRWMNYKSVGDRRKPEYTDGVNAFLDFAFAEAGNDGKIRCPCVGCCLESFHNRKIVFYHLLARGILMDYNPWTQHGEDDDESDPCEDHEQAVHEKHLPGQSEKENRDVSEANEEDGNNGTPAIPSSVWRYVGKGGEADEERDDCENQDISVGEYGTRKKYVARRGRGRPRRIILKELEENSGPVKVDLPAQLGRVVGPNAQKFIIGARYLLKQTLPLNVVKWKDLNPDNVAMLLGKVKERFIFPNESHVDDALLWQFKLWFRNWRTGLRKNYYSKYETYEERLANCPPGVVEAQWRWLVDYWSTEEFKELSKRNYRVRSGQKNETYELQKVQSQHDAVLYPSEGSSKRKRETQTRSYIREKHRLIWEELASSSANASGNGVC